jgi:flagellar hook assembly protein FlgD
MQIPVAVAPAAGPARLVLSAPAPNPSRGRVSLTLELAVAGHAEVAVFDAGGRRVRLLASGPLPAGRHPLDWDGRDEAGARTPAGVYFVRAHTLEGSARRRLVRVE